MDPATFVKSLQAAVRFPFMYLILVCDFKSYCHGLMGTDQWKKACLAYVRPYVVIPCVENSF